MNCDTIFCILKHLRPLHLLKCGLVNKQFNSISKSELLWKRLREFNHPCGDCGDNGNCKNNRDCFILYRFLHKYNNDHIVPRLGIDYSRIFDLCDYVTGYTLPSTVLRLPKKNLETLPYQIDILTNLQDINLRNNKLQSIPIEIYKLTNLQELYLSCNQIDMVPKDISKLINLQELYLYDNKVKTIPEEIGLLTNLIKLDLSHNRLRSIPQTISRLTKLEMLVLDHNKLKSIPEMSSLKELKFVRFDESQKEMIPCGLKNLKVIKKS
jgi:Leucine-rich repeat (LRR) protein